MLKYAFAVLLVASLLATGCSDRGDVRAAPDEAEFTFFLLGQVAPAEPDVIKLFTRWNELCTSARSSAARARGGPDARDRSAYEEWVRDGASQAGLLREAQDYLRGAAPLRRLVFTAGGEAVAHSVSEETWEVAVGDRRTVLLEVRNKTAGTLTAGITGSSSDGFYVWPWEGELAPGRSLFSLLAIEPALPGEKQGFVALEIAPSRGKKSRVEMKLKGRFSNKPEKPQAVDPSWKRIVARTSAADRPHAATVIVRAARGTPSVALLGSGRSRTRDDAVELLSPGEVRFAAPPQSLTLEARCGPGLAAPALAVALSDDMEVDLKLSPAAGAWIGEWCAGSIFPLLPESGDILDTLLALSAENLFVGHIGSAPRLGSFGRYPVTLAETFRPGPCLAAKGAIWTHPAWGSVLAVNVLASRSSGLGGTALPSASDWPDLVGVCEEINRLGGKAIGLPGYGPDSPSKDLELVLAGLLGKLDAVLVSEEFLPLWYELLSCGVRLPPAGILSATGSSRAYVHLAGGFTYERYLRNLCGGAVFVTSGPVLAFSINGRGPGAEIRCAAGDELRIQAEGLLDGVPIAVEVVENGSVLRTGTALSFVERAEESSWFALRAAPPLRTTCHTGPLNVSVGSRAPWSSRAADKLLARFDELVTFVRHDAFFASEERAAAVLATVKRGRQVLEERLAAPLVPDPWAEERRRMVQAQLGVRSIQDANVLRAMEKVPRHLFLPETRRGESYADFPVPIGYAQTISQPYIVAFMTEALKLQGNEKVLEIGTGSGYQAAILAELARDVYTIEIVEPLMVQADKTLRELNYRNVHCRFGDGYRGWPEEQPFDAIIVTAAPDHVPPALIEQLAPGGRMIVPIGVHYQNLRLITKRKDGTVDETNLLPVLFVPMTGAAQQQGR